MRFIISERYRRGSCERWSCPTCFPTPATPSGVASCATRCDALRRLPDVEVELYEFPPGGAALIEAARRLHRHHGGRRQRTEHLDVVHAHFGLTAWPALAARARVRGLTVHGTDVRHPRTRVATRAVLPLMDLVAAPTPELARRAGPRGGRARRRQVQVLPCGVDMERFHPIPRASARAELGLDPRAPCLLFPADPARPASATTARWRSPATCPLHTLGGVAPEQVPLWVNAANAVVVPSEAEGFGLAVLEALACDVPVLATPVGVHRQAMDGVAGALCAPFDVERWRAAAAPHLDDPDPRIAGRAHAEQYSATADGGASRGRLERLLERGAA